MNFRRLASRFDNDALFQFPRTYYPPACFRVKIETSQPTASEWTKRMIINQAIILR
jgi:hypothetical protein